MDRRKIVTVVALVGVIGAMGTLTAFAVPLYQLFCRVTGYGGTTRVAVTSPGATPAAISGRMIAVRFNADVNSALPWRFRPAQGEIEVRLGETAPATYTAQSLARVALTGTATFNVTPAKAGPYFNKIECFCFTEQTLAPAELARMPVSFFVDPEMANDRNLDDVTTITLSYTFFRAQRQPAKRHADAGSASGEHEHEHEHEHEYGSHPD